MRTNPREAGGFSALRTLLSGLSGGVALNFSMLLTFRLIGFGWDGGGMLLDPAVQSPKLIAVWTELEPLPLIVSNPMPIIAGLFVFSIGHAFIYRWVSPPWPVGVIPRAMRLSVMIFFLSFLFWEFFTPINQFGEPLPLVGLEVLFWAVIALSESFAIAAVMEMGNGRG